MFTLFVLEGRKIALDRMSEVRIPVGEEKNIILTDTGRLCPFVNVITLFEV